MTDFASARSRLVENLGSEIRDRRVLEVMARVPREEFVPAKYREAAYEDRPLPIGFEQTISQPYIIALMTEALRLTGGEKVLELGTGSGYQTAILAELARTVVTIERLGNWPLRRSRCWGVWVMPTSSSTRPQKSWAGRRGPPMTPSWSRPALPSYRRSCSPSSAAGGRMVIPVGSRYMQELCQVTRGQDGVRVRNLGGCRFVSLIGKNAWRAKI